VCFGQDLVRATIRKQQLGKKHLVFTLAIGKGCLAELGSCKKKVSMQSAIMNKVQVTNGAKAIPPPKPLNETHATEKWCNK
jgi:hypothetical protein